MPADTPERRVRTRRVGRRHWLRRVDSRPERAGLPPNRGDGGDPTVEARHVLQSALVQRQVRLKRTGRSGHRRARPGLGMIPALAAAIADFFRSSGVGVCRRMIASSPLELAA
jgi:hypothetical protein